jgi:nucleoside phosphorylase
LGAFEREVTLIEDQVSQRRDRKIEGVRFVSGKLNGQQVVVTWTGVGKVNAAMTTTLLIEHYKPKRMFYIMAARNSASLVAEMVGLLGTKPAPEKNAGREKPRD